MGRNNPMLSTEMQDNTLAAFLARTAWSQTDRSRLWSQGCLQSLGCLKRHELAASGHPPSFTGACLARVFRKLLHQSNFGKENLLTPAGGGEGVRCVKALPRSVASGSPPMFPFCFSPTPTPQRGWCLLSPTLNLPSS